MLVLLLAKSLASVAVRTVEIWGISIGISFLRGEGKIKSENLFNTAKTSFWKEQKLADK